jgi:hypothetical protein
MKKGERGGTYSTHICVPHARNLVGRRDENCGHLGGTLMKHVTIWTVFFRITVGHSDGHSFSVSYLGHFKNSSP